MTTDPQDQKAEQLLIDLLARFVAFPLQIGLASQVTRHAVFWTIQPHPSDYGKINGKSGTHIRALEYLMFRIGLTHGKTYGVRLCEAEYVSETDASKRPRYEPASDYDLIKQVLGFLGNRGEVESESILQEKPNWKFVIYSRTPEDYSSLIGIDSNDPHQRNIVSSLGTLWRAIGKAHGVGLTIEAKPL